jgi:hypothetical protein
VMVMSWGVMEAVDGVKVGKKEPRLLLIEVYIAEVSWREHRSNGSG